MDWELNEGLQTDGLVVKILSGYAILWSETDAGTAVLFELQLEAQVGADLRPLRPGEPECLMEAQVVVLNEVGNDEGGGLNVA